MGIANPTSVDNMNNIRTAVATLVGADANNLSMSLQTSQSTRRLRSLKDSGATEVIYRVGNLTPQQAETLVNNPTAVSNQIERAVPGAKVEKVEHTQDSSDSSDDLGAPFWAVLAVAIVLFLILLILLLAYCCKWCCFAENQSASQPEAKQKQQIYTYRPKELRERDAERSRRPSHASVTPSTQSSH
jgi:hypothetical protein